MNLKFATVWFVVAGLLALTFGLCFAVPPETPFKFYIHVGTFASGLLGYVLLKAFAIAEYFIFVKYECCNVKSMCYIWSLMLMTLIMAFFLFGVSAQLVTLDVETMMAGPVPDKLRHDHGGNLLVFFTAIGPPLQWLFAPKELCHTCHLVDATQCTRYQPTFIGQPDDEERVAGA